MESSLRLKNKVAVITGAASGIAGQSLIVSNGWVME